MFITGDKDLSHICTWFLCCLYFTSFPLLRWFLTSSKKQKARETWKCVTATTGAPEPTGIWRILITSLAILGMWFMVLGSWFWCGWSRYFFQQITVPVKIILEPEVSSLIVEKKVRPKKIVYICALGLTIEKVKKNSGSPFNYDPVIYTLLVSQTAQNFLKIIFMGGWVGQTK